MQKFRVVSVVAVLISLVVGGCSTVADVEETVTSRPLATVEPSARPDRLPAASATATTVPTLIPSPSATPEPTTGPAPEDLAPIGAYEVLTLNGETSIHLWLEFLETCLRAGDPTLSREGMTIRVTIPMMRDEAVECVQQWSPAKVYVPLDTSGMEPGTYTIVVNGNDSSTLAWEYIAAPPTPPAGCPAPEADTALFVDETGTYCVLIPAGWHMGPNAYYSPLLTGGSEPVRVTVGFAATESANGRTVDQVVEGIEWLGAALADPNLDLRQEAITVGGEPAVLVRNTPGIGGTDMWYVIHNGTVYEGWAGPRDIGPSTPYVDEALDLFMHTLTWLR